MQLGVGGGVSRIEGLKRVEEGLWRKAVSPLPCWGVDFSLIYGTAGGRGGQGLTSEDSRRWEPGLVHGVLPLYVR